MRCDMSPDRSSCLYKLSKSLHRSEAEGVAMLQPSPPPKNKKTICLPDRPDVDKCYFPNRKLWSGSSPLAGCG